MIIQATLTSKGQLTVPKGVRDALGLEEGDTVLFRVGEERTATISKVPDFIAMAGSVEVPPEKRGTPWSEILRQTYEDRARRRH